MYVITAATGNTGKEITEALLKAGKPVRVVGRSAERLQPLVDKGAEAAVGDLEDAAFLSQAFRGATAVYAVVPPKWDVTDWRAYQLSVGRSLAQAIREAGVRHVVVLSSNGAHMPEGAGPVSGLFHVEAMLKAIPGLHILSLRAGYFMQNLYAMAGMIRHMGFMGYALKSDVKVPMVHTRDIAAVATRHLLALDFSGYQFVFVPGDRDYTMAEVAAILGKAIGKPDLSYVTFMPAEAKAGMLQAGIPETIADGYLELFHALSTGEYLSDFVRTPQNSTPTSLEQFAREEFAPAFAAS